MDEMWYVYLDWTLEETPRVFYVGKGSGKRDRCLTRNAKHTNIRKKHGIRRERLFETKDESFAFEMECKLIEQFGTYDRWGANLARGGEGPSGFVMPESTKQLISQKLKGLPKSPFSDEHREKIAAAKRGKKLSEEHKRKIRENARHWSRPIPSEERARISAALRGQVQSDETKRKRSESMRRAWARRKSVHQAEAVAGNP